MWTAVQVQAREASEGAGSKTGDPGKVVRHTSQPADRAREQGGHRQETLPPPGGIPVTSRQERLVLLAVLLCVVLKKSWCCWLFCCVWFGLPVTRGLRVFDELEPKFTPSSLSSAWN